MDATGIIAVVLLGIVMTILSGASIRHYCTYRKKLAAARFTHQMQTFDDAQRQQQVFYYINPSTPIDVELSIREASPRSYDRFKVKNLEMNANYITLFGFKR
jgi:hypothetical protein